jgi:hypothetical protein
VFKGVLAGVEEHTQGKQTPWVNYSLKGDFFFVPSGVQPTPSTSATATTPQVASMGEIRADESAWREIENSRDPEDFRFFLEVFPESPLAKTAKFKLRRLERKQGKTEQERIAKQEEEERKRQETKQRRIAEAKRKRQEELGVVAWDAIRHANRSSSK